MVFSNVNQDNGRVIKGSAIMGFLIDPKNCLDDAAGDLHLQTMGCSLFYKKCQQVDRVSKLILLGVPNSIKKEVIKDTIRVRMHTTADRQRVQAHQRPTSKLDQIRRY